MALSSEIDAAGRILTVRYVGPVAFPEWAAMADAVMSGISASPRLGLVIDRRDCDAPTTEFTKAIAAYLERHRAIFQGRRIAYLVTAGDETAFGMARMQEMLNESSGAESQVFTKEADARAWAMTADIRDSQ
jgi:hypothetical protein